MCELAFKAADKESSAPEDSKGRRTFWTREDCLESPKAQIAGIYMFLYGLRLTNQGHCLVSEAGISFIDDKVS
jgi:hypothetical protein